MFDKAQYDKDYAKAHVRRKFIPFNDMNPEDVLILEWLAGKENVTQYVKQLIIKDLNCSRCNDRTVCGKCVFGGFSESKR